MELWWTASSLAWNQEHPVSGLTVHELAFVLTDDVFFLFRHLGDSRYLLANCASLSPSNGVPSPRVHLWAQHYFIAPALGNKSSAELQKWVVGTVDVKNHLLSARQSQSTDTGRVSFSFSCLGLIFLQKLHITSLVLIDIQSFGKKSFFSSGFITRPVSLIHMAPID